MNANWKKEKKMLLVERLIGTEKEEKSDSVINRSGNFV